MRKPKHPCGTDRAKQRIEKLTAALLDAVMIKAEGSTNPTSHTELLQETAGFKEESRIPCCVIVAIGPESTASLHSYVEQERAAGNIHRIDKPEPTVH